MKFLLSLAVCVACVAGFSVPLSEEDKLAILKAHNELRGRIANGVALPQSRPGDLQPTAANMREMEWSPGIEAKAKEYALQGKYAHSSSSFRTYNDGEVNGYHGENLAWYWTSADNYGWKVASADVSVDGWITSEEKFYHFEEGKKGKCFGTPARGEQVQCGHYTQGVWADSYLLGCASTYQKKGGVEDKNAAIVICQYNDGNVMTPSGFEVYKVGTACSKCPSGWNTCNNGLCSRGGSTTSVGGSSTAVAPATRPSPAPAPAPSVAASPGPDSSSVDSYGGWLSSDDGAPSEGTTTTTAADGTTTTTTVTVEEVDEDGAIWRKTTTTTVVKSTNGSTQTSIRAEYEYLRESGEFGFDAGNTVSLGSDDGAAAPVVKRRQPILGDLVYEVPDAAPACVDAQGKPCNPNKRRLLFGGASAICTCK